MEMDLDEERNQKRRTIYFETIKSIKRHLDKPKAGTENLYYIPPYEKGLILCAVKMLRENYFDPDVDIAPLNFKIFNSIRNVLKTLPKKEITE
jgi:hypothetical protein